MSDQATPQTKITSNSYYSDKVFPELEKGGKHFNWYAAFFGLYWYPSKGLIGDFAKLYIPLAIIAGLESILPLGVQLGTGLCVFYLAGKNASRKYYQKCKTNPAKDSVLKGIGFWILYMILVAFVAGFSAEFTKSFKETLNKRMNTSSQKSTLPPSTNKVNTLDFMDLYVDFNNYRDKEVSVEGVSLSAGGQIQFSETFNIMSSASITLNIDNLSKDIRKSILSNCGDVLCEIKITGIPYMTQYGQKGILVSNAE
jgi:hypothetical protein